MRIETFGVGHVPAARALALADYDRERRLSPGLPPVLAVPNLREYAENGLGAAAFEGERMVGFLGCVPPFDNAFRSTDVKGIFSPMGANGAVPENRARIYAAMYQAAGEKWVKAGAVSHAVCLYAHEEEAQRQFFCCGFGVRCMDAIRPMEPIPCAPCGEYAYVELPEEEYSLIYPLELALYQHYRESPFFMNRTPPTEAEFLTSAREEHARYFAAVKEGRICAQLRISSEGETFLSAGSGYRHITGAYCLPEHRGRGVYPNLLNAAAAVLKAEGYTHLGVDFESINPTAYGFWRKYFSIYTHGLVRRIDERILCSRQSP